MPAASSQVRLTIAEAQLDAGAETTSQLGLSEVPSNDTQPETGCSQPFYSYIAKQANHANTQTQPLGTPENPIGSSARSGPY